MGSESQDHTARLKRSPSVSGIRKEIGKTNDPGLHLAPPHSNQGYTNLRRRSDVTGAAAKFLPEGTTEARWVFEAEIGRNGGDRAVVRRIGQRGTDAHQSLALDVAHNASCSFEQTVKLGSGNPEHPAQCGRLQLRRLQLGLDRPPDPLQLSVIDFLLCLNPVPRGGGNACSNHVAASRS